MVDLGRYHTLQVLYKRTRVVTIRVSDLDPVNGRFMVLGLENIAPRRRATAVRVILDSLTYTTIHRIGIVRMFAAATWRYVA